MKASPSAPTLRESARAPGMPSPGVLPSAPRGCPTDGPRCGRSTKPCVPTHHSPKGDPQRIVAGSRQNQATGNNRTLKGLGRIGHDDGSNPARIERGGQSSCRRRCPDAVGSRRATLRSIHPQRATAIRKRSSERIGRTPLPPPARSSGVHDIRPSRLCGRILGRLRSA